MFDNLSGRLSQAARNLSGKGRLTESNVKDTLRQVRLALLEADVALPVVKAFIERIRENALGETVSRSVPGRPGPARASTARMTRIASATTDVPVTATSRLKTPIDMPTATEKMTYTVSRVSRTTVRKRTIARVPTRVKAAATFSPTAMVTIAMRGASSTSV